MVVQCHSRAIGKVWSVFRLEVHTICNVAGKEGDGARRTLREGISSSGAVERRMWRRHAPQSLPGCMEVGWRRFPVPVRFAAGPTTSLA